MDFEKILSDPNFDKTLLIENLHNCETKAQLFLHKKNLKSEKLSFVNDTMDDAELGLEEKSVKHPEPSLQVEEESKCSSWFYIVIFVLIGFAVLAVGFKVWYDHKSKQIETKIADSGEEGIKSIEKNHNVTIVDLGKNESKIAVDEKVKETEKLLDPQSQSNTSESKNVSEESTNPVVEVIEQANAGATTQGSEITAKKPVVLNQSNFVNDQPRKMAAVKTTKSLKMRFNKKTTRLNQENVDKRKDLIASENKILKFVPKTNRNSV